jgi:hypothetical protein
VVAGTVLLIAGLCIWLQLNKKSQVEKPQIPDSAKPD